MRRAPIVLCAFGLVVFSPERASAAQACAWIVEVVEDDGSHMFKLDLSVDAPASVAVRFRGPGFTSASMGGEMIDLEPGEPQEVDGEGFEVSTGDALGFEAQLYDRPMASLEEMNSPTGKLLAAFAFHRTVGVAESAPPPDLAVKQCKPLG
ncbi:MAG TPA: hypothetical protein VGS12_15060 [Caulobacteraceae bacterium]|nr:hypothetical protein [Caulobacteraceae bacterium]